MLALASYQPTAGTPAGVRQVLRTIRDRQQPDMNSLPVIEALMVAIERELIVPGRREGTYRLTDDGVRAAGPRLRLLRGGG